MRRPLGVVVLAGLLAGGCGGTTIDQATEAETAAAQPGPSTVAGDPLPLPARWWRWTEAAKASHNPIDDETGASCAENQPDDVWFLAGTHGGSATRACAIPRGRPVYFPVLNWLCDAAEGTAQDALAECAGDADRAVATLDGKPLDVVEATSEDAFTLVGRRGSTTLGDAGPVNAVTWGLWVGPLSIPAGEHTLRFSGRLPEFKLNVTYHLTIG